MKSKKTLSLLFGILLTSTAFANTTDLGSVTLHFTEQNMHNAPQLTFYYGGKFDLAPGYFSQEINLSNGTKIVLSNDSGGVTLLRDEIVGEDQEGLVYTNSGLSTGLYVQPSIPPCRMLKYFTPGRYTINLSTEPMYLKLDPKQLVGYWIDCP